MIKSEEDKKLYHGSTNNNLPIFPSISVDGVWEFNFNYTGFLRFGYNFCHSTCMLLRELMKIFPLLISGHLSLIRTTVTESSL